jgi:hypothetical protein
MAVPFQIPTLEVRGLGQLIRSDRQRLHSIKSSDIQQHRNCFCIATKMGHEIAVQVGDLVMSLVAVLPATTLVALG